MGDVRVIEVKQSVFADNDRKADELRATLRERGTFLLNLMSSPGSGKTTTLTRTIEALKDELSIAVMEADIDSDVDARTILDTGVRAIQLHTGGMCHLDACMTEQGPGRAGAGCRGCRPRRCCGWRCRRGGCRVPCWFHGRRGRGELRCAR